MGVLYLRATVNIPPEGDDKLTLNLWLYDFQRMPFWQYALQDLQGRLRYFTLQEVRFFPFHYPNIRYTEDGGAAPYDYASADNARDDLPCAPENYELLDMDDFLPAEAAEMKPTIQRIRRPK